jgi:hypothetical protein
MTDDQPSHITVSYKDGGIETICTYAVSEETLRGCEDAMTKPEILSLDDQYDLDLRLMDAAQCGHTGASS